MNALAPRSMPFMTADEFLAWPGDGTGRTFQLVDGGIRPVSPASSTHGLIQSNLAYLLGAAQRAAALPILIMTEGAIIPGMYALTNVRVPDVVVTAAPNERGQQTVPDPILIIEIISPGNQDDTRDNIRAYATLPSVRAMAVLHSARLLAEVHYRGADGNWPANPELIGPGQRLILPPAALDCLLEAPYAGTWLLNRPRS